MATKKKSISSFNKFIILLNIVLAVGLLVRYFTDLTFPKDSWRIIIGNISIPAIFLLNAVFIGYWLIQKKMAVLISVGCVAIYSAVLISNYGFKKKYFISRIKTKDELSADQSVDGEKSRRHIISKRASAPAKYFVKSAEEFNNIIEKLDDGDDVTIANGTYENWSVTIPTDAAPDAPIKIHAETPGKVKFTGNCEDAVFSLSGAYIQLSGFLFERCDVIRVFGKNSTLVSFNSSLACKLSNCTFLKNTVDSQFMPIVIISGKGDKNEVVDCSFISNVNNIDLQIKVAKDAFPTNTLVYNNTFKDKRRVSWRPKNGGENVQVGQDNVLLGQSDVRAIVKNNKFINCAGDDEIVSNKSSGNKYVNNYFENCSGELVLRGGSHCLVDSNVFKGGKGLRIHGTAHVITNNTLDGTGIGIRMPYGMAKGAEETAWYTAASECVITGNTFRNLKTGILIGENKDKYWGGSIDRKKYPTRLSQDVLPADNKIEKNNFANNSINSLTK